MTTPAAVAPDRAEREELTQLIRADLYAQGKLGRDAHAVSVLVEKNAGNKMRVEGYEPGDKIQYKTGQPKHCLKAGPWKCPNSAKRGTVNLSHPFAPLLLGRRQHCRRLPHYRASRRYCKSGTFSCNMGTIAISLDSRSWMASANR